MNKCFLNAAIVWCICISGNAEAAKCISGWKIVDCKTIFGNKEHHYCVVDTLSTGQVNCYDCKSGVGGYVGKKHCGGWSVGYDFVQEEPTGELEDTGKAYREVQYGKCTEEKNHEACGF